MTMLRDVILDNETDEARRFHLLQTDRGGPLSCDIPRDVFRILYEDYGYAPALTLLSQPDRPFAGVPVHDQPRDGMDTWKRWLARAIPT